jgi:hypothetical protein
MNREREIDRYRQISRSIHTKYRCTKAYLLGIFQGRLSSLNCTADGAGLDAHTLRRLFHSDEHLWRGTDKVFLIAQIHEEAIGARVAPAQPPEHR